MQEIINWYTSPQLIFYHLDINSLNILPLKVYGDLVNLGFI